MLLFQSKKRQAPQQTLNNARGYVFPYGDLKHLPPLDDAASATISVSDMARIVNQAVSSGAFIADGWHKVKQTGASSTAAASGSATASLATKAAAAAESKVYNDPSEYIMRYMMAGECTWMLQQLGSNTLPCDFWNWYMQRAGRGELSNSYQAYAKAYIESFGNRLAYLSQVGTSFQAVKFRHSMLSWSPGSANQACLKSMTEQQQAALKK